MWLFILDKNDWLEIADVIDWENKKSVKWIVK